MNLLRHGIAFGCGGEWLLSDVWRAFVERLQGPPGVCSTAGVPAPTAFRKDVEIVTKNDEQRLVFGWLYVARKANGEQVVDHSGETISIEDLEKAGYGFVLASRKAGEMHEKIGVGRLVECVVFTAEKRKAMGIPDGVVPDAMWVGFKVDDDDAWKAVKNGTYKMLSLGGSAVRNTL